MSEKRTIHGIDPTAPGGIEALLEHHRALFGDATMSAAAGTEGGTGGDGGAAAGAAGAGADGGQGGAAVGAQQPSWPTWDGKVESLPEDLQKFALGLRKEAGDYRVKANSATKEAEGKIAGILKALGLREDGTEDPTKAAEAAAAERDTARSEALKARRELAIFRSAATHSADPARLLDSTSFLATIDGLDPAKDGEKIDAAIKAAVESNPYLKATRAVGASGIEQTGGSGVQGQITEEQLKGMSPEQIVEAQEKGLLKSLLGG